MYSWRLVPRHWVSIPVLALALAVPPAPARAGSGGVVQTAEAVDAVPQTLPHERRPASKPADEARPSRSGVLALIDRTAGRYGVERALVRAIVAAESAYNARAVSRVGARGLMQLMPATAADYGVKRADALFDPAVNVTTGVRHLKRLLDKYGNDYGRVIMAYNAGEGAVDRAGGHVTYAETLAYTEAVVRHYRTHGGNRPMDAVLRKVSALRGHRETRAVTAAGKPAKRAQTKSRRASTCCLDLAEGDLDRALRVDRTDGDFGGAL